MHSNPADGSGPSGPKPERSVRTELWLGTPEGLAHFDPTALTAEEQARLQSLRHHRRIEDFQISRALRSHARTAGMPVSSLSHSGGYAALLQTSAHVKVGVDIEVHRARDPLKIANFAFPAAEIDALEATAPSARLRLFYTLWTAKEALAKALGLPLVDALRLCTLVPAGAGWTGSAPTDQPWAVQVFEPRPGMSLAAACVGLNSGTPIDWMDSGVDSGTPIDPPAGSDRTGSQESMGVQCFEWPAPRGATWATAACASAPAAAAAPPATAAETACGAADAAAG